MKNNIVIYVSEDGLVKVDVDFDKDTVWLTAEQMSSLFDKNVTVIRKHINNIFREKELDEKSNAQILRVSHETNRPSTIYSLDVIISVGYRVKSKRGTQFRIWANKVLKEFMIKGFSLDDERLKNNGKNPYFEELLSRIRDIRSSKKVFWRKVLDIYSTSIDYDPKSEDCIRFFKTVQNKMHWAATGHTAAELVFDRVSSKKPHMGLTNFEGDEPTIDEVEIAKNYLSVAELDVLNRMVSSYLDVAELRAMERTPMRMVDWEKELQDFLKMTRKDILNGPGRISHKEAMEKAHKEYRDYSNNRLTRAEKDYLTVLENETKKTK
jgi:hypothetical protein